MQRYYVPKENWQKEYIRLPAEDAHHVQRVMRQKVGDKLICNHPDGKAATCIISQITDQEVYVQIEEWLEEDTELPIDVTIVQGLPKGNKLELIFQKGTELGVHDFYLYEADRSVAKWDHKKASNRLKRYDKIIKEATEQCHRSYKPVVHAPKTLTDITNGTYDHIIFAYEEEAKNKSYHSFADVLNDVKVGQKILFIVGPEGGFSEKEVILLKGLGAKPVRLGKRILRTETASLYALASISYHFEEWRCQK